MVYHRDERGVQGGPDDRVFFWYSPPEKFMPLQHTREELAAFGLPPVPDATLTPEAHDFWEELYSGDLTWAWAMGAGGVAVQSLRPSQLRSSVGESLYESSANWSGLYITPRDGEMVTEMHGTWTVTEPSKPPGDTYPLEAYHSSTWIGLDGQRAYYHSSLPQIGTEQYLAAPGTLPPYVTRTFWQWWSREAPGQSLPLPLHVEPGHVIMCALVVVNQQLVTFVIKNKTTNLILSPFDVAPPVATPPLLVSGATAEWMMERSTHPVDGYLEQLPKYEPPIPFTLSGAVSAFMPGQPGRDRTLMGGRRVTMRQAVDGGRRSKPISRPNSIVMLENPPDSGPHEQQPHDFTVSYVPS